MERGRVAPYPYDVTPVAPDAEAGGGLLRASVTQSPSAAAVAARRLDARVQFSGRQFVAELVYNLLLNLAAPLVVLRHGVAGARHRAFLPDAAAMRPFLLQVVMLVFILGALALWISSTHVRARVSGFEVAAMVLLHVAR